MRQVSKFSTRPRVSTPLVLRPRQDRDSRTSLVDDLKNEGNSKKEDDFKKEDHQKNEKNPKNEDAPKNEDNLKVRSPSRLIFGVQYTYPGGRGWGLAS